MESVLVGGWVLETERADLPLAGSGPCPSAAQGLCPLDALLRFLASPPLSPSIPTCSQLYNKRHLRSLTTLSFWKTGVLMGAVHGAVCFFIPYYSLSTSGQHNVTDVYSLGKIAFVALLGTVTLEVALVARYWTWLFGILTVLSYVLVYPYLVLFPLVGAPVAGPCGLRWVGLMWQQGAVIGVGAWTAGAGVPAGSSTPESQRHGSNCARC